MKVFVGNIGRYKVMHAKLLSWTRISRDNFCCRSFEVYWDWVEQGEVIESWNLHQLKRVAETFCDFSGIATLFAHLVKQTTVIVKELKHL